MVPRHRNRLGVITEATLARPPRASSLRFPFASALALPITATAHATIATRDRTCRRSLRPLSSPSLDETGSRGSKRGLGRAGCRAERPRMMRRVIRRHARRTGPPGDGTSAAVEGAATRGRRRVRDGCDASRGRGGARRSPLRSKSLGRMGDGAARLRASVGRFSQPGVKGRRGRG